MTHHDAAAKARDTYNSAADSYDDPANSFWDRFGRRTVERLELKEGAHVLDVCCGSGASAIPAAEKVGPAGSVLGVDLAENLLELAHRKARAHGLGNLQFRAGDMLDLGMPEHSFDTVICVFGIFFVQDMGAAMRRLWQLVRPGGRLAITTWGPRFLEPASTSFWNAIRLVKPDLYRGFNPWDRVTEPEDVRSLFAAAGIESADIVAERGTHPLNSPESWWPMVLGTGYRGTVDQLDPGARDQVRESTIAFIRESALRSLELNVLYAVAPDSSRSPG